MMSAKDFLFLASVLCEAREKAFSIADKMQVDEVTMLLTHRLTETCPRFKPGKFLYAASVTPAMSAKFIDLARVKR